VVSLTTAAILVLLAAVGALSGVVWNNVFWVVFVTAFSTIIGLAIAVLADRSKGEPVAKSLIFLPMAISFVGASIIWRFVYAFTPAGEDQIGLLNAVWVGAGGQPQAWIQQTPWNNLFLIVIMIWIQTGFAMIVLSSAIKGVPVELLEAARMDGASEAQAFWRVTLPQIRPTLAVVVTTLVITVLKIYDIVKVMTNGEFGTSVIANEMFDQAFINRNYGMGSALAVLLFVAVVPLMVINVRRVRKGERA
jgi:alpha-glucoside transport system permease protein